MLELWSTPGEDSTAFKTRAERDMLQYYETVLRCEKDPARTKEIKADRTRAVAEFARIKLLRSMFKRLKLYCQQSAFVRMHVNTRHQIATFLIEKTARLREMNLRFAFSVWATKCVPQPLHFEVKRVGDTTSLMCEGNVVTMIGSTKDMPAGAGSTA